MIYGQGKNDKTILLTLSNSTDGVHPSVQYCQSIYIVRTIQMLLQCWTLPSKASQYETVFQTGRVTHNVRASPTMKTFNM